MPRLKHFRSVRKLQQQLQEEMELHAILENAIKKNDKELFSQSCLPHQGKKLKKTQS
ncbi:hypothetical protein RJ640_003122 [Escallonia rubra]|uniref:Ternary complex factor MIP1 leucine-zipper domain-containing protein n=1 Tax=Escallonia rubra TaxID=112253 RepID=A0AA88QJH5_9ASTE|nr:hypothetical protein RJ640_003122 [Escallonia rubra]